MKIHRSLISVSIAGLLISSAAVLWRLPRAPRASDITLTFTGRTKRFDRRTGTADGREGVTFSVTNLGGSSLCLAAFAANDSNIFPLNSQGFGLRPHSGQEFTILVPTSSIPWRVIVRCSEATFIDPDKNLRQKLDAIVDRFVNGQRYYFERRDGAHFTLISTDFRSNAS